MSRPWETGAPRPWEAAQPIYDRLVTVMRSKTEAGPGGGVIGPGGYSGPEQGTGPEGEVVLFVGLPASIQQKAPGKTRGAYLPADIAEKPGWVIEIPIWAPITRYSIRDRDILVDDEGYRYGVGQNRWTVFGYRLACIRLEV
jgi:hypothetical protein